MAKKSKIPVYQAEKDAGIADIVQSNASIAYLTTLEDLQISQDVLRNFFASASEIDQDQFDLYYLNTILVSTGWNKNSDIFDRLEVWNARYSPVHKQFNLGHDQSKIIGHMTSTKVVDTDYEPIPDDATIDTLPDKFHILTGAVIYKEYADQEKKDQIEKLIAEIEDDQWRVSMECLLRGFDYGVMTDDGEQKVIVRSEETAFLTKHLRQYGGSGRYKNMTLGRLLRNITFSGKGLVKSPANPDSIIFNKNIVVFNGAVANLGYIQANSDSNSQESVSMADENKNESQVQALQDSVASLEEAKKVSDERVVALEAEVQSKTDQISQLEAEVNTLNTAKVQLEKDVADASARAEKAEEEIKNLKVNELVRSRVSQLVAMGCDEIEANNLVKAFVDKSDEDFNTMVNVFAALASKKQTEVASSVASEEEVPKEKEEVVVNDPIADATPEVDSALAVNQTNTDVEDTRVALSQVFASILSDKKVSKKSQ